MAANYGAHEVLEIHEVLSDTICGINTVQLYSGHCKDSQLRNMLNKQLQFMSDEYNNLVRAINQQGMGEAVPYKATGNFSPTYGLRQPSPETPNTSPREIDDRDISAAIMGIHKCGAQKRMLGALECANPQLRRMLVQAAVNCEEQAFEVWQYMNSKGYYQVPTMQQNTTNTMMNTYQNSGTNQYTFA